MESRRRSHLVLVANNPFGHHLLTSQLLDHYQKMDLQADITLLCNGRTANADPAAMPGLRVVSFASRLGGAFSYLGLLFRLIGLRAKDPDAVYHLRGFVAGAIFFASRLGLLGKARYIYDPRGAFFIEWREAGRSRLVSRVLGWIELRLIKGSMTTIVTSERFARLYRMLFRQPEKYLVIYNSTSFSYRAPESQHAPDGPLRVIYLGTFNKWHDMGEISRVMAGVAQQAGPDRTEIFIYTASRFHDAVRKTFGRINCARLIVDYVNYRDIPSVLSDKHIGVSVVCPTLSTRIASPIKVADYIALGLIPLLNSGIGDFDQHYRDCRSAILYHYGKDVDLSGLSDVRVEKNEALFHRSASDTSVAKLKPYVTRLLEHHR
jgi:hypothetical protein